MLHPPGVWFNLIVIICCLYHSALVRTVDFHCSDSDCIGSGPDVSSDIRPPSTSVSSNLFSSDEPCFGAKSASLSCSSLPAVCLHCDFNTSCTYGQPTITTCQPREGVVCQGETRFNVTMNCRYCYQTATDQYTCTTCNTMLRRAELYSANCTVDNNVLCMGRRKFHKKLRCKWTNGTSWRTTLLISILFGGFGGDRFYLGHWQDGLGKFFSFGGLGVWTVVDVILIATGYLGPADGSIYI